MLGATKAGRLLIKEDRVAVLCPRASNFHHLLTAKDNGLCLLTSQKSTTVTLKPRKTRQLLTNRSMLQIKVTSQGPSRRPQLLIQMPKTTKVTLCLVRTPQHQWTTFRLMANRHGGQRQLPHLPYKSLLSNHACIWPQLFGIKIKKQQELESVVSRPQELTAQKASQLYRCKSLI
jgi:hypothetical protein